MDISVYIYKYMYAYNFCFFSNVYFKIFKVVLNFYT